MSGIGTGKCCDCAFLRITNSNDLRRVWTANFLNAMQLPDELSHKVQTVRYIQSSRNRYFTPVASHSSWDTSISRYIWNLVGFVLKIFSELQILVTTSHKKSLLIFSMFFHYSSSSKPKKWSKFPKLWHVATLNIVLKVLNTTEYIVPIKRILEKSWKISLFY